MKLIVTIPALNEAATIEKVVRDIPRDIPGIDEVEVIVVNDGSEDDTAELARRAGAIVVTMVNRPGLGPVWRLGMERAIRRGADIIVNLDGDGQFDSRDVATIVQPILRGEADFVTCSRFATGGPDGHMSLVKRIGNRVVTNFTNFICGTNFTDVSCGFRAYNREAAYRLAQFGRWTYTEECIVYLTSRGLRLVERPFKVRGEREFGDSRVAANVFYFASHLAHILVRAVRDGRPLKFFGWFAVVFGAIGVTLLGWVFAWWASHGILYPYEEIMTVGGVFVTIGFFFVALALLADMTSRHRIINEEMLYLARRRYFGDGFDKPLPSDAELMAGLVD